MRARTSKTNGKRARSPGLPRFTDVASVPALNLTTSTPVTLKKILVSLDFSAPSKKALRYAVPLAERFDASLCLLHVLEPPSLVNDLRNVPLVVSDAAVLNRLHHKLVILARQEIKPLIHVNPLVRVGRPSHEIVTAAKDLNVDLIVIATHGHTGLKHVVLGSTAERVVRHAPCPVLVVREHDREFVSHGKERV